MNLTLIIILAGVVGFVLIAGVGLAFAGGSSSGPRTVKRANGITSAARAERGRARAAANDPGQRRKALLKTLKEHERERKATVTLNSRLEQAGLSIGVAHFWIASAVFGLIVAGVIVLFRQPPLIGLGAGFIAGAGAPRWLLGFLAKRRIGQFTAAFSDSIDIIVRGIKSGLPVHDCLRIIAKESPPPLGPEFHRLVENVGMGMTMDQALEKMYARMPTAELRFFTIVLAIQQKAGGNLAEALSNLSSVLRARKLMREKVKALSSEAVTSAFIIGCLPPSVVTLITVTTPSYMKVMFIDPRGKLMLMIGACVMSTGIWVMRRMINFKF